MRRRQDRVDVDMLLNKYERGNMAVCRATNISLSGMRLQRLLEPYQFEDGKIRLELELDGSGDPVMIGAEKVYDAEGHVGVRFTDISHQHFRRLREFISEMMVTTNLPAFA